MSGVDHTGLVTAMARGDERAAARLYDEYRRPMYDLAVRIVGEKADAEEVVLEAFSQAWSGAAHYKQDRSSVLSWLSMMTRTRALDHARARSRRSRVLDEATTSMIDEAVGVAPATPGAAEKLEHEERVRALGGALRALSGPQRVAIELAFFGGLTHPQIAEFLGEPLGTVKTRIRLGMQHMRQMLSHLSGMGDARRDVQFNLHSTRGYL